MKRRDFLKTATLSAFGIASFSQLAFAEKIKKIPIAVQLYSVRNIACIDLVGTLKKIASLGYDGVEFAGYYGKSPKDIRKMLDDYGLKCAGTHIGLEELEGDKFERTIEIHKILGTKFMIVSAISYDYVENFNDNKKYAERFNVASKKASDLDMYIGYHPHSFDAKLLDGIPAWERLFDQLNQKVIHQMDLGNYLQGGGDPYKMIEKFKGRTKSLHLKETGKNIIGTGKVDWKKAFELCETVGGTEWYVVEDEHAPDSFDRIENCIKSLREMGK